MRLTPLATALGVEVTDLDLSAWLAEPADESRWRALHDAFVRYSVLVIRDQALSPSEHVTVASRFGVTTRDPLGVGVDGVGDVTRIVKEADEVENFGHQWHRDMSFLPAPPKASVLVARDVPEVGGDTVFASLARAHACLSAGMQRLAGRLNAIHENWPNDLGRFRGITVAPRARTRRWVSAPLVAPHPERGDAQLMVSPFYARQFEGMTLEESEPLFSFLNAWATRTEFTCRVRWAPGTVVVWDNRAVIHDVPSDDFDARLHGRGFRREMHRVTVNDA